MNISEHGPPRDASLAVSRTAGLYRNEAGPSHLTAARFVVLTAVTGVTLLALAGCTGSAAASHADPIVIAATATGNEPEPALSWDGLSMLRSAGSASRNAVAYLVSPAGGEPRHLPLTPRRANGEVEYGPQRGSLLAQNIARVQAALVTEAATRPFDLLGTMAAAARVASPPATMLLLSSGVTTSGGLNLRDTGWDNSPSAVATQLKHRGLLPDLTGWTVIFSGLGQVMGDQPALPLPQQTTLTAYWMAICREAGASHCQADNSPRPLRRSRSRIPVPVVPVPRVQSVAGPHGQHETVLPSDLLFAFSSARLLPGADRYLAPVAGRARSTGQWISITGQASPDGGTPAYNRNLSLARARAVRNRLIALGTPTNRIFRVTGIGTAGQSCTVNGVLDEARCARLRRVVIDLSPAR